MSAPIAKGATAASRFRGPVLGYRSAREGFGDLLSAVGGELVLPGYIGWSPREGSGVYDPVVTSGIRHHFYRLHDDLTVDVDDLRRLLAQGRGQVVLVIHYFGRTDPAITAIGELCRSAGAVLVEDLAHGLCTYELGGEAGRVGDAALFSLHKMLPIDGGGFVRYSDPALVTAQSETTAQPLRSMLDYDVRAIALARRERGLGLRDLLLELPGHGEDFELLWPDISAIDAPQTLPVRVLSGNRDGVYAWLNDNGVGAVSLYHTLIPQARGLQPTLDRLSSQILNLPVHQDVPVERLESIAALFARSLQEAR